MTAIRDKIIAELAGIEEQEGVRILYACESGSRAWGFPSKDSDYDVRFIYIRPQDWYLSLFDKRDVIERPINSVLDINGWDLKKALRLFRKSNPPLLEWLQSPIVYLENAAVTEQIRSISTHTFSPKACMYHYLHMARGNYREYLQGELVKMKKYFYVLRPILACEWIERYGSMPPMEFERLVDELVPQRSELKAAIDELLVRKRAGDEMDLQPRMQVINDFIEQRIAHIERAAPGLLAAGTDMDQQLDELFRALLKQVWKA